MTTQLAVRLPDEQVEAIDRFVPSVHETRSDLIRRAIELYLYRLACEHDAKVYAALALTDAELSIGDDVRNWEAAPAW